MFHGDARRGLQAGHAARLARATPHCCPAVKRACITGGAGFIGSNLADRLVVQGVEVVIVDDFRSGRREFVAELLTRPGARLVEGDVLDRAVLDEALEGCDWVFHLQANADVRRGLRHPRRDLEQNTIATSNVLEAMRAQGVKRIVFSSTGSVYGEPEVFPDARGRPLPAANLAVRSLQARRRGPDLGLCDRATASPG